MEPEFPSIEAQYQQPDTRGRANLFTGMVSLEGGSQIQSSGAPVNIHNRYDQVNINIQNTSNGIGGKQVLLNGNARQVHFKQSFRPASAKPLKSNVFSSTGGLQTASPQGILGQDWMNVKEIKKQQQRRKLAHTNKFMTGPYGSSVRKVLKQDHNNILGNPLSASRPTSGKRTNPQKLESNRKPSLDVSYVSLSTNQDREQLYQAAITFKQSLNTLSIENQQLKTQIQYLHKEIQHRDKIVEDMSRPLPSQLPIKSSYSDTILNLNLKRQLWDLQQQLKDSKNEVEGLKRNLRSTRLEELESAYQELTTEAQRLRYLLQGAIANQNQPLNDDVFSDQEKSIVIKQLESQVRQLLKDKEQLSHLNSMREKEIQIWRQRSQNELKKGSRQETGNSPRTKEIAFHKQKYLDLEVKTASLITDNSKLKETIKSLQAKASQSSKSPIQEKQVPSNSAELDNLKEQLSRAVQEKAQAEQQMQLKEVKLQKVLSDQANEITKMNSTINSLQQQLKESEIKLQKQQPIAAPPNAQKSPEKIPKEEPQVQKQKTVGAPSTEPKIQEVKPSLKAQLEMKPVIKESDVKSHFEVMRRVLQIERISKEGLLNYLFDQGQNQREESTIKQLQTIFYLKFHLTIEKALEFSRFLIEKVSPGQTQIEYSPETNLVNRKIVKALIERVLGQYEVFTEQEEQHVILKYQELAFGLYQSLYSTLQMYDEQDKGIISVSDLVEGLASVEVFDGKDKRSLDCFTIHLLRKNHKDTNLIKISDLVETLYPTEQSRKSTHRSRKSDTRQGVVAKQKTQPKIEEDIVDDYPNDYEEEIKTSRVEKDGVEINVSNVEDDRISGEDEIIDKSEKAFALISNYLKDQGISLRNLLQGSIRDKHLHDPAHQGDGDPNKTFEIVNAQEFFDKLPKQLGISVDLIQSAVYVAAKHETMKGPSSQPFFVYKDLEEILGVYGFVDHAKPKSTRNLNFELLDQKSIRIMNRLAKYLESKGHKSFKEIIPQEQIFKKPIKNVMSDHPDGFQKFELDFIGTKDFFTLLKTLGIRQSDEPHPSLMQFLLVDHNIYKKGLLLKKIEKVLKECLKNPYLVSMGLQKKFKDTYPSQSDNGEAEEQYSEIQDDIGEEVDEKIEEKESSEIEDHYS